MFSSLFVRVSLAVFVPTYPFRFVSRIRHFASNPSARGLSLSAHNFSLPRFGPSPLKSSRANSLSSVRRVQTGIAASVDLRCYGVLTSSPSSTSSSSKVTLVLPDLEFSQAWESSVLPWDLAPSWSVDTAPGGLDANLLRRVEELAEASAGPREKVSVAAFLYLLVLLGAGRDQ